MKAQATIAFVVAVIFSIGAVFTVLWVAPWPGSEWRPADFATAPADDVQ